MICIGRSDWWLTWRASPRQRYGAPTSALVAPVLSDEEDDLRAPRDVVDVSLTSRRCGRGPRLRLPVEERRRDRVVLVPRRRRVVLVGLVQRDEEQVGLVAFDPQRRPREFSRSDAVADEPVCRDDLVQAVGRVAVYRHRRLAGSSGRESRRTRSRSTSSSSMSSSRIVGAAQSSANAADSSAMRSPALTERGKQHPLQPLVSRSRCGRRRRRARGQPRTPSLVALLVVDVKHPAKRTSRTRPRRGLASPRRCPAARSADVNVVPLAGVAVDVREVERARLEELGQGRRWLAVREGRQRAPAEYSECSTEGSPARSPGRSRRVGSRNPGGMSGKPVSRARSTCRRVPPTIARNRMSNR